MKRSGWVIIKAILDPEKFEKGMEKLKERTKRFTTNIKKMLVTPFKNMAKAITDAYTSGGGGFKGILKVVGLLGSSITKTISGLVMGVAKFAVGLTAALGIIGLILTAVAIVAMAFKKVTDENAQLKTDIQYIIFGIKTALQPAIDAVAQVIVKIINWLIQIFKIIAMIISAIAGKNVFAGATADAFAKNMKKAEKSSKGVAKNAKEVNKQLASFDEMNVLSDTSSSGGGGVGGVSTPTIKPSFDWANLEEPTWIKKIKEHFDKIKPKWETFKGSLKNDWEDLKSRVSGHFTKLKTEWETFTGIISTKFQEVKDKIIGHFTKLKTEWESFKLGLQATLNDLKYRFIEKWTEIKNFIQNIPELVKTKWADFKTWINNTIVQPIVDKWTNFKENVNSIWTAIKDKATSVFTTIKTFITDKIIKPITDKFTSFKTTVTDIFNKIKDALKGPINTMIGWINKLIDGLNKISIKVPAWVNKAIGNGNKESTWGFNIKKIPKLAKGGVINMPGKGVAIGGERGKEGVIPLTDSQQMELLGEAIGRYITINANIVNSMNGRIISKELQKIQNENSFAGNR